MTTHSYECVVCRYLRGSCERTDGSCPLSHKICKEKVCLEMMCRNNTHTVFHSCRCLSVLFSYGVFASEKIVLTFTLVLVGMLTSAWTLLRGNVQKESRCVIIYLYPKLTLSCEFRLKMLSHHFFLNVLLYILLN